MAIQNQPFSATQWSINQNPIYNCPPGLEYLTRIDQIFIEQEVELLEVFTGFETQNKYSIKNIMGQQVYFATEESDCLLRQCCKHQRSFIMHITDNMGYEVMRVFRPYKFCSGSYECCANYDCCANECEIQSPVGQPCGYVRQIKSCFIHKFEIRDAQNKAIFILTVPFCLCQDICCRGDIDLILTTLDGKIVGKISKKWSGLAKEYFTKADNFGIKFPMDLSVKMKATLIGCTFLVDFMYFEFDTRSRGDNNSF